MGRLSRPLVPDGPIRHFYDRLHALHVAGGQPSVRQLQRRTRSERRPNGINPTTIHAVFVTPRLSRWEVVREVVRQLGGDIDEFRELWRRAREAEVGEALAPTAPDEPAAPGPVPRELPPDVSGFTGRADLIKSMDELLAGDEPAVVIMMLAGGAGAGKTALAVHWGHRVRDRFPDGQLYLDLRGFAPGWPMPAIEALAQLLRALGLPPEQVPAEVDAAAARYRSLLADRRVLVVLDNAADADQVRPLLPGTPGCLALVTSRDRLSGLVARDGAHRLAVGVLTAAEAEALLARLLGADNVAAEPDATADLARACAFLPLALRVAAADLVGRPQPRIADYVAELRDGGSLAALDVDDDPRTAVRATFDLSYRTITVPTQRLFRLLGLVPGPDIGVEAAAALAGAAPAEVARLLDRLAAAHLIGQIAPGRYACHDLLRQYAGARSEESDPPADREAALTRLYDWYLARVDAAARVLYPHRLRLPVDPAGPAAFDSDGDALHWLDAERANLMATLRQAAKAGPRPAAWLLADSLRGYFWLRMHVVDWTVAAQAALAAAEADGDLQAQAAACVSLGDIHYRLSHWEQATEYYSRALAASQRTGWVECEAATLMLLGCVHRDHGRLRESLDYHVRVLDLYREIGSRYGEAVTLVSLGRTYYQLGQPSEAHGYYTRALAIHREIGSRHGEVIALHDLGEISCGQGRLEEAASLFANALTLARQIGDRTAEAYTLRGLATVHRDGGRPGPALRFAQTAVGLARDLADPLTEADAMNTLATVHHRAGRNVEAVEHHRRALELTRATGKQYAEVEALIGLAAARYRLGQRSRAAEHARDAVDTARRVGFGALEQRALALLDEPRIT